MEILSSQVLAGWIDIVRFRNTEPAWTHGVMIGVNNSPDTRLISL